MREHTLDTAVFPVKEGLEFSCLVPLEEGLDDIFHVRPFVLVEHVGEEVLVVIVCEVLLFQDLHEVLEKLLLDACDSEEDAVFASVDAVERCTAVEPVLSLLVVPETKILHL